MSSSKDSTELHGDVAHQPVIANKVDEDIDLLVVGSVALDTIGTIITPTKLKDSNIGKISNSIGGVGYNMALASSYVSKSTKFLTRIGNDFAAETIIHQIAKQGVVDTRFLEVQEPAPSTRVYMMPRVI